MAESRQASLEPIRQTKPLGNEILGLAILLVLGCMHAIFYVFFIPPWYHHDEPTHLEYVILVARLGRVPELEDRQQDIAYAIGTSMIESGFSEKMGLYPNLNPPPTQITQIGYSQIGGPPLYYWLASLPVRLYQGQNILIPLYLARGVSAFFYLINILAAWGLSRELFTRVVGGKTAFSQHFMHFALPTFLVLWPAHLDIMTAVNTDAPAIAFSGLALWGSIRMIRIAYDSRRFTWVAFLGAVLATALALLFKETAVVILPALAFGILFALPQCIRMPASTVLATFIQRQFAWAATILLFGLGPLIIFDWNDASYWVRLTAQPEAIRMADFRAPNGSYVGRLALDAEIFPPWHSNLYQPIIHDRLSADVPATFTFGVWMWADVPLETDMPAFAIGSTSFTRRVSLTSEPQFFAYSFSLEEYPSPTVRITIKPKANSEIPTGQTPHIYLDALVLVKGNYSLVMPPTFSDHSGDSGIWDGVPFTNILRNGSFEQNSIRFMPWIDRNLAQFIPDKSLPSAWLQAMIDWDGFYYYYRDTFAHLFRTFWARFSWGNLALVPDFPMIGAYPYRKIGYLCLAFLGMTTISLGFLFFAPYDPFRVRKNIRLTNPALAAVIFIFGFTMLLAWGMTLLRGALYTGVAKLFYPVARYALPAVLPSLLTLLTGWGLITEGLQTRYVKARRFSIIIFLSLMLLLNALSIVSISRYLTN
jgi:hypothetical protein